MLSISNLTAELTAQVCILDGTYLEAKLEQSLRVAETVKWPTSKGLCDNRSTFSKRPLSILGTSGPPYPPGAVWHPAKEDGDKKPSTHRYGTSRRSRVPRREDSHSRGLSSKTSHITNLVPLNRRLESISALWMDEGGS